MSLLHAARQLLARWYEVIPSWHGERAQHSLRVLGVPAFRYQHLNPYNALLYRAIIRTGVEVHELTARRLFGRRYDIVHIHWPEYLFCAPGRGRALLRAAAFVTIVSWLRGRHTRIVWTVHNLGSHDQLHPRLEHVMWKWFVDRVDGYIALTIGGRAAAVARYPVLAQRPGIVIPHGHYRDAYPTHIERHDARGALHLPPDIGVICFFGAIRTYKNVPALLDVFRDVRAKDWRLVIAGNSWDDGLSRELRTRASADERVRLDLGFVQDDRVQVYMRAADLVVLPYREVLNSGSAVLALSFGVPLLVPAIGATAELRERVGDEWIRTYDGQLSTSTLHEAMLWARRPRAEAQPPLADLGWPQIAQQTVAAYRAICTDGGMRR